MTKIKSFKKISYTIFIIILTITCICSSVFATIDPQIKFDGIDLRPDSPYKYRKKPLENNSKYKNDNYKQKYSSMTTQILDAELSSTGDAYVRGLTKLKFRSPGLGYTGGVFVVAKDKYGGILLIMSGKTGAYLDIACAYDDDAQKYGWGVDWTIGSHDYKKWNWKYGFKWYREVEWDITIPATVMALNPTIEIIQCHTPSYRALKALNEFAKNSFSFVVYNAVPISTLVISIVVSKSVTYQQVSNVIRGVVNWTYSCEFMNLVQYRATISIINACDIIAGSGLIGIIPGVHNDVLKLVYAIRGAADGTLSAADSIINIFNSLSSLSTNVENISPPSFEQVIVIMRNLQILLNEDDRLSFRQNEQYTQVISVCETIFTLQLKTPIWGHMGLLFDGIKLAIDISKHDSDVSRTEMNRIKYDINEHLGKIRNAIIEEFGDGSTQATQYNTIYDIVELIFNTIDVNANWQTELIETTFSTALNYLNQ